MDGVSQEITHTFNTTKSTDYRGERKNAPGVNNEWISKVRLGGGSADDHPK